ncbi:hypothetical protein HAX54_015531 [Datura stramonium]|uniref:Uncharacterized protein n=1 Tax=Datura stramonium TaxID=4076 RepID=A0ABS8TT52_DATST|nr:hypothetical protein [Datura stramonium]
MDATSVYNYNFSRDRIITDINMSRNRPVLLPMASKAAPITFVRIQSSGRRKAEVGFRRVSGERKVVVAGKWWFPMLGGLFGRWSRVRGKKKKKWRRRMVFRFGSGRRNRGKEEGEEGERASVLWWWWQRSAAGGRNK